MHIELAPCGSKLIGVMLSGIKGGDSKEMVLLVLELCCLRTLGSNIDNAIRTVFLHHCGVLIVLVGYVVVFLVGIDLGVLLVHHDAHGYLHLAVETFIPYLARIESLAFFY